MQLRMMHIVMRPSRAIPAHVGVLVTPSARAQGLRRKTSANKSLGTKTEEYLSFSTSSRMAIIALAVHVPTPAIPVLTTTRAKLCACACLVALEKWTTFTRYRRTSEFGITGARITNIACK
jgi:hypothetical protein